MPLASVNGIDLYYEIHGKGEPIVLIAGLSCDCLMWSSILNELSRQFQVVIFDNRGAGRSSNPDIPYSVEMMAEDTMGLIDKLKLKRPHILGHSMGGTIAQALAYKYPTKIDKLILCSTSSKLSKVCTMIENNVLFLRQSNFSMERLVDFILPWLYCSRAQTWIWTRAKAPAVERS